jgi:hypothetical protein
MLAFQRASRRSRRNPVPVGSGSALVWPARWRAPSAFAPTTRAIWPGRSSHPMSESFVYSAEREVLQIRDSASGGLRWEGTFDGGKVVCAVTLPRTADCVVLIESSQNEPSRNVLRVGPDGGVVWRADSALSFGAYVAMALRESKLMAWSWSGHMVRLDLSTGSIIESVLTR